MGETNHHKSRRGRRPLSRSVKDISQCTRSWISTVFPAHTLDEKKRDQLLQNMLQQSAAEWGHEVQKIEHGNHLLTKYWYKKHLGVLSGHRSLCSSSTQDEVSGEGTKIEKTAGDCLTHSQASASACIKAESRTYETMQKELGTLKKHKLSLQKVLSEGLDLSAELDIRGKTDDALKSKAREIDDAL